MPVSGIPVTSFKNAPNAGRILPDAAGVPVAVSIHDVPGPIVVVHAHPDDETIGNSGLLALARAEGIDVTVVTCTRGERGEVIPADLKHLEGDGPALAERREQEIGEAMTALGGVPHFFLDRIVPGSARLEDSGMVWASDVSGAPSAQAASSVPDVPEGALVAAGDEPARSLAKVLRDLRPALVITYEPDGGYGHPDHVRAHQLTMSAVAEVSDEGLAPQVWWTVVPPEVMRAANEELAKRSDADRESGIVPIGSDFPLPSMATVMSRIPSGTPVVALDASGVAQQRARALASHSTQIMAVELFDDPGVAIGRYALSNRVWQPIYGTEYYVRATATQQEEAR